jgi:hypothetical protein
MELILSLLNYASFFDFLGYVAQNVKSINERKRETMQQTYFGKL